MKKIFSLIFLGVIFVLTPFTVSANYYSIDQEVIDLNNYTLNEVFTDTINDLEQYKIETNILDTPIYEGLSLRDIFENDTEGITLPNGIKTFEISGNDLVQRVKKYTLQASDIIVLDNLTAWQRVLINKPLDYIGYNLFYTSLGSVQIEGFTTANYNNSSSMIGKVTADAYAIRFTLGFSLGTYADLVAVQIDLADTIIYYQLATPIVLHTFTTAPSQAQLDEWLSFYLDPSTIASFDTVGDIEVYKVGDNFYNLTAMKSDQVYSTYNLDTFDNLLDAEITDQFGAWQTLGIEDIEVLSLTDFQTFAPALDQEDMLYWFNYYNLILEYDEVQAGILSDLEITILIIGLILYIIGMILALFFKNRILFVATGLLWFIPIVIVPNIFIVIFSAIMIIVNIILAFFNEKENEYV